MCDGVCGGNWCDPDCEFAQDEGMESEERFRINMECELVQELVKSEIVITVVPA